MRKLVIEFNCSCGCHPAVLKMGDYDEGNFDNLYDKRELPDHGIEGCCSNHGDITYSRNFVITGLTDEELIDKYK